MALTADVESEHFIHLPEEMIVGKRLVYWALANTYHVNGTPFTGPVHRSSTIRNVRMILYFDNAPLGLTTYGKELTNFGIAGADDVFLLMLYHRRL